MGSLCRKAGRGARKISWAGKATRSERVRMKREEMTYIMKTRKRGGKTEAERDRRIAWKQGTSKDRRYNRSGK